MILDHLDNWKQYHPLHSGFGAAFEFLVRTDPAGLPAGRHDLDDRGRLFVLVMREEGKGRERSRMEAHRNYIDIQYTLDGLEEIGWKPVSRCAPDAEGYDSEKDIIFFIDRPEVWCKAPPGTFAIFFPEDGHAPLGGTGPIAKLVVKVAID